MHSAAMRMSATAKAIIVNETKVTHAARSPQLPMSFTIVAPRLYTPHSKLRAHRHPSQFSETLHKNKVRGWRIRTLHLLLGAMILA